MLITPLQVNEVHLWTATATDESAPQPFWDVLSQDERDRANRFYFDRDRVRFAIFRGTLRHLLGGYLGQPPADIAFAYAPKGKPSVSGIDFNVSHSHDMAVFAFGHGELGVDIEWIRREVEIEAIARRFFTEDECAWIFGSDAPAQTFFDCWTRKEAYIKAEGGGLSIPLTDFSVLQPLPWQFYSWRPAGGYIAAAAVKGKKSFIHRIVQ